VHFKLVNDDCKWARKGDNLIYTHSISLEDSFNAMPIKINALDGRVLNLNIDKYITPQTVHLCAGEGMPKESAELSHHLLSLAKIPKGNLYVKFNIVFPNDLTNAKKKEILAILAANKHEVEQEMEDE